MQRFRKSTIKDVAARAGVSTTTVSVFVSGREEVCSPETGQRIRAAITELHYTPSSLTRGLRQRATKTIGLCTYGPMQALVSPHHWFVEEIWRGVSEEADEQDYATLYYPKSVRCGDSCDAFLDGRVDGLVSDSALSEARAQKILAAGMPLVILTRSLRLPEGSGSAYANETMTVDLALSYLWNLGHRRIAHLTGPLAPDDTPYLDDIGIARRNAYEAWMQARGVYDPDLVSRSHSWEPTETASDLADWRALAEPPTAVFAANDTLAEATLRAAAQMGLRVPHDLSVVGVDNHRSDGFDPPLTSVAVPVRRIGHEGLRALLRLMEGAPVAECRVAVPVTDLIVRESAAPPRSAA